MIDPHNYHFYTITVFIPVSIIILVIGGYFYWKKSLRYWFEKSLVLAACTWLSYTLFALTFMLRVDLLKGWEIYTLIIFSLVSAFVLMVWRFFFRHIFEY